MLKINLTWRTTIPTIWRKSVIIPIQKPGKDAKEVSNYCPISLNSIVTKTMEHMVCSRLNWYLEFQQLLSPARAGFRKYHSINQQIARLSQDIKDLVDKAETVLAVFIDFKGAYDSVWRLKLQQK